MYMKSGSGTALGNEERSGIVIALRRRKSPEGLILPLFFMTIWSGEAQEQLDGLQIPSGTIFWNFFLAAWNRLQFKDVYRINNRYGVVWNISARAEIGN